MADGSSNEDAALHMLDAFASVGTTHYDLTLTDCWGAKVQFRRGVPCADLRRILPGLLTQSDRQEQNIIIRPASSLPVFLVQLDDLDSATSQKAAPVSLLQLQTSPGNFQAWIALPTAPGDEFTRRLRQGTQADPTASGASRLAGSRNFKTRYAPNFPRIAVTVSSPGLLVTPDQLAALELVAPPATPPRVSRAPRRAVAAGKQWPNYEHCLREAPAKRDHSGPDTSRADFTFSLIALDWGWNLDAVSAQLMELSDKAREEGERYAVRTVRAAEAALARRHGKPPHAL